MKIPICKKPCSNCPFRKDSLKGWLGKSRAQEIADSDSFVCHKTVNYSDLESERDLNNRKQCAGFMILKKDEALAVSWAKVLSINLDLKGFSLVFDSKEDFIKHHSNRGDV